MRRSAGREPILFRLVNELPHRLPGYSSCGSIWGFVVWFWLIFFFYIVDARVAVIRWWLPFAILSALLVAETGGGRPQAETCSLISSGCAPTDLLRPVWFCLAVAMVALLAVSSFFCGGNVQA